MLPDSEVVRITRNPEGISAAAILGITIGCIVLFLLFSYFVKWYDARSGRTTRISERRNEAAMKNPQISERQHELDERAHTRERTRRGGPGAPPQAQAQDLTADAPFLVVTVPAGVSDDGRLIQIPKPGDSGEFMTVAVPEGLKEGDSFRCLFDPSTKGAEAPIPPGKV